MSQKERILCAALLFRDTAVAGHRHHDCYYILTHLIGGKFDDLPGREAQGFLTSHNRFVDRKEAYKIALENNQLLLPHEDGCEELLISENLY